MAEFDRTSRGRAARHMSLDDNREARSSRMEELAREMARRQAEADQRRREEEERRRQQEAERQRREAEQRAEGQKRQQEEESRMRLLEAQKQNERAQRERGALVLAGLNNRDHENYQRAIDNDQMLTQETWERDWAIRNGDTQAAERSNAWINDRKNQIRQNTIPQTRSVKTLAEYQDEWNADRPRKSAIELAIEARQAQKKERSQEGLSQYTAAQSNLKQAQEDKDAAAKEQTELKMSGEEQEVYTYAAGIAKRFGYSDDQIPATLEELADLDPAIGQDDVVRNYLTYKGHVQGKVDDAEQRIQDSDKTMRTLLHGDQVSAEDWADLQKYNSDTWNGKVFSPFAMTKEEMQADYDGASAGIRQGGYNDPQYDTARQMVKETGRRLKILDDPKKALAELDEYIAFYEGLSGGHWDDMTDETNSRLKADKAQRVLLEAYTLDQEPDWHQGRIEAGRQDWLNAEGRSNGDRNLGLHGSDKENRYKHTDVTVLSNPFWDDLSDEGDRVLYMNDKERETFFYLYSKSPEKAREFMDALDDEYHDRRTEKQTEIFQQEADRTPVLSNLTASGLEITKGASAMVSMVDNLLLGNEYHEDSFANYADTYQRVVRDRSKESLTKWAEKKGINPTLVTGAFDVATSIGDNLMRAYGTAGMGITNSAVTTGIMAFGAAGSTMRDLMAEGVDPQRAALVGGVAGIAEYVTEKWSDAKLFEVMDDGWIGLKNGIKSAAESAFMEGWTEEASNLLQLAGEAVILQGEDSFNKKVKDYYYYTGSMEEARKLAVQDMIGEGIYTMVVSGLSGAGMDIGGRTISGVWNHYTKAKQKELSGEGDSTQADTARDSYGTQDGAEAAAEGAMPQYSSEELDEALMAAAAPMTAQEQQTDSLLDGQQTADAVQAEADAQRAAEAAEIRRNDNVARIAREMAAGENARLAGVEEMPVERRSADSITEEIDSLLNESDAQTAQIDEMRAAADAEQDQGARQDILGRVQGMQAEQLERWNRINELRDERRTLSGLPAAEQRAEPRAVSVPAAARGDRVAGVEAMPVERRQAVIENAEPGTAAERVNTVKGLSYETAAALSNPKARQFAENWVAKDADDSEVMKQATLAAIRGNTDEGEAGSISDDTQWHEAAGAVYDEIYGKYGKALASGDGNIWQRAQDFADGKIETIGEVLSGVNDPLLSAFSRDEVGALMRGAATEYKRHADEVTGRAREAANKYGFKAEGENGTGNGVVLRTVEKDLTPEQVTQLRVIDRFAKQLKADGMPGLDINVFGSLKNTAGQAVNGSYSTDGSVKDAASINVSLDAEGGNILRAAGHEMYHMIEQWGSNQATKIKGFVLNALEATEGYDLDERRAELKEIYSEDTDVDSEIVADSMFEVLGSEENITAVMKEQPKLGARIVEFVKRIGASLKRATERIANLGSKEAKALKDQSGVLDTIRTMWEEGVRTAQKNIQAARVAENAKDYSVQAVADADGTEARAMALDTVADELVTKTQGAMLTADTDRRAVRRRMTQALTEYGRGQKSLAAALSDHGLQDITNTEDRSVAAWYAREMAEPSTITKSDRLSVQSLQDTFRSIWDDNTTEGGNTVPRPMPERALNLMYDINAQQDRKGNWVSRLSQFVDQITEGNGNADKNKVKDMLTLLYSAIDNDNRVYTPNAARYAELIADELGTVGLETGEQAGQDPAAGIRDTMAERIILNYFSDPTANDSTQRAVDALIADNGLSMNELLDYYEGTVTDLQTQRNRAIGQVNRMKRSAETRKQRAMAERNIKTMRQWILHPTKQEGKHVSEGLRSTIATALSLVNTSSARNPDSIRTYDFNMLMAAIENEQRETGSQLVVDPNLIPTLKELAEKTNGKMLMEMDGKELADLNTSLNLILKMCRDADKLRSRQQKEGIAQIGDSFIAGLQQQDDAKVRQARAQGTKDFLNYTLMDPQRFFEMAERLGGEAGKTMWEILRKTGFDKQVQLTEELRQRMDEAVGQYDYKNWAGGKNQRANTFDLDNGAQITLTDGQIMDLYLLNQREQGRQHIYGDGIIAKRTDLRGRVLHQNRPVTVTEGDVNRIISALSDEQIACADALQKIVGEWGSQIGNEASMDLYGYKKFKEQHYFPIKTLSDTLGVKGTELEKQRNADSLYAVTNLGMTKELKEKARNAIVLGNVFDVALDHMADMITYRSWAAPLTDVTRILNYKTEDTSVIREMNRVMGESGTGYLLQLLRNINGITKDSVEGKAAQVSANFRNFKAAMVGFNPSTVLKQGLSLVRAFDVIPVYYFPTARQITERFKREGEKGDRAWKVDNLMAKYAPIYTWKQAGRFTMDTGKDLKSVVLPQTEKAVNKITEFGMKGAGMADDMTWRTIWYAAERMIERTRKDLTKGTEEYYRAVGAKFSECIDKTQVVDSVLHRTEIMRSNSMFIKMATSFMGEPLKTYNMMANAVRAFSEKHTAANAKKLTATSVCLLGSALLTATVTAVISGFRHWSDDEPLEETIKKYLLGDYDESKGWYANAIEFLFGNAIAGEVNPINYIPIARDLSDMIQGYDVTRDDMQTISNLLKKGQALIDQKGSASTPKKIAEFAGALGDFIGVPGSNVIKEANYMTNWGSRVLEKMGMDAWGIQYWNLQWNKQIGQKSNLADYAGFVLRVEQAVKDGECEQGFLDRVKKDLIEAGYDEKELEKKVAKIALGDYSDDDNEAAYYAALAKAIQDKNKDTEKNIRARLKQMGKDDTDIDRGLKKTMIKDYTDKEKADEWYDDWAARMLKGDRKAADAMARILSMGVKEESHNSDLKGALSRRPEIIQAAKDKLSGNQQGYMDTINKCDRLGFDHDMTIGAINAAVNRIKTEEKKANGEETESTPKTYGDTYGYSYSDLSTAFIDESEYFGDILDDLRKQGKKDEDIKKQLTTPVKKLYLELKYSNPAAAERLKQRLIASGLGYTEKQIRQWKPTKKAEE